MQNLSTFRTADFLRPCLRTQLFLQNNWKKGNVLLAGNVSNMLIAWSYFAQGKKEKEKFNISTITDLSCSRFSFEDCL